jgi:hypothetical protein
MRNAIATILLALGFAATSNACLVLRDSQRICPGERINVQGAVGTLTDWNPLTNQATIHLDASQVDALAECHVELNLPRNNPHRAYDTKFRACKIKAANLGLYGDTGRSCIWQCMHN